VSGVAPPVCGGDAPPAGVEGFAWVVVVVGAGVVVVVRFEPDTLLPVVAVVFVIVGVFVSPGTVSVGVVGSGSAAFLLPPPPQATRNGARAVRAATERAPRAVIV
jgi:hypothetical protein